MARPFVVDAALTAIAIGYRNDAQTLIADRVFPRVDVPGEKFKWLEYPLAEGFTVPDTEVGRRGRVERLEFSGLEKDASVKDYGLETPIPYTDIETARALRAQKQSTYDPEMHAAMMLAGLVGLAREVRVAARVQNPLSYNASRRFVFSGTSMWSDYANSDPIKDIKNAIRGTLVYRANTLVMGSVTWNVLSSHPKLVNAIRGGVTGAGIVMKDEVARLFEVKDILVGESYVNLARPGQGVSLARTWGNFFSALYIDPTARAEGGVTFGLTGCFGSKVAGRIEDPDIGLEGGYQIRTGERLLEFSPAPDVGVLYQNVVTPE